MVDCPYCYRGAIFLPTSEKVYGGRDFGPIWYCEPCQAWVGCHRGTREPLGRLADAELRKLKQAAHRAFDPLWKAKMARSGFSKQKARTAGYKWLAQELGLSVDKCHIGMFDAHLCQRVIEICDTLRKRK